MFNRVYNDPDTSNIHHFLQAYYEMDVANYNNAGTDPLPTGAGRQCRV